MNVSIEEEINQEFVNQISELPSDLKDPVENTLEYIKKRAVCSDYEAAQIQSLMSEQSAQKTGYKYYCRYIAGQSTPEEDNTDYYKSIRKSWNKFLDKFANMTLEERAEAFTVVSASVENIEKVLNNADFDELEYINSKTEKQRDKLEELSNELSDKSKSYLITHPTYTLQKVEVGTTMETFNKRIIRSVEEHKILKSTNNTNNEDTQDMAARRNIVKAMDTIRHANKNVAIREYTKDDEYDEFKKRLVEFDVIQLIEPSRKNFPMYKYLAIKKNNEGQSFACDFVDLEAITPKGEPINITEELKKSKDFSEIDHINLNVTAGSKETANLDGEDLTLENFKYYIKHDAKHDNVTSFSDLGRIYDTDPTSLEYRLKNLTLEVDKAALELEKTMQALNITLMVLGSVIALIGIVLLIISVCYKARKNKDYFNLDDGENPKTPTWPNILTGRYLPLLLSGLSMVASAIGILIGGNTSKIAKEAQKKRDNEKKDILTDIQKHNQYPKKP